MHIENGRVPVIAQLHPGKQCAERGCCFCVGFSTIIAVTSHRIIYQEKKSVCGLQVYFFEEYFRLKDLQHMSLENSLNKRYALVSLVLFIISLILMTAQPIAGGLVLALAVLIFGLALLRYCGHVNLRLDFYKEETVNAWMFPLFEILGRRKGSSIHREIPLSIHDAHRIMDAIYLHVLSQYHEDILTLARGNQPILAPAGPSTSGSKTEYCNGQ